MQRIKNLSTTRTPLALLAIFFTVLLVYVPNSQGVFLLDDWPSLADLNDVKAKDLSWSSILAYTFGGSGFPGRPISLFSFAVQAESWPSYPENFKYVNVIIHAFNAVLVYLLSSNLLSRNSFTARYAVIGGLWVSAVWALHPMFASSVLYVVQRMTLLSALFCLLSLNLYILLYDKLSKNRRLVSSLLLVICTYLGVLLGVLAKENAIALSLIVFGAEIFIFSHCSLDRYYKLRLAAVILPFLLLVVYLTVSFEKNVLAPYAFRDFSLSERIATQFSVFLDYFKRLIIISPREYGLFHDNYPVSSFSNLTVKSISGVFLLVFLVLLIFFIKDKIVRFGVFFFLSGHILESTIIPLEIYFEHRNYLPAVGLFLALFALIVRFFVLLKEKAIIRSSILGGVAACGLLVIISFSGWLEARLWSEPMMQAHIWYERDRTSLRALGHYGALLEQAGDLDGAFDLYEAYYQSNSDLSVALMMMHAACKDGRSVNVEKDVVLQSAEFYKSSYAPLLFSLYIIMNSQKGMCESADLNVVLGVLDGLLENEKYVLKKKDIHIIKSKYYAGLGDLKSAYQELSMAQREGPSLDVLVGKAQIALMAGDIEMLVKDAGYIKEFCKNINRQCYKYDDDIREVNEYVEGIIRD